MDKELSLFCSFGLATPMSFSYSQEMNAITGNGFMSEMGNTYFNALRFADGILIKEDVGRGFYHTFLNGLKVYDIKSRKLLVEKRYPTYQGAIYSKELVKNLTCQLLTNLIIKEARAQECELNELAVSTKISELLNRAFAKNQFQEMKNNIKVLGL